MTTLADLDLARQADHDQIETDTDLDAFGAASYWQALRRYGVPWLVAALLVVRRAGADVVVVEIDTDGGEGDGYIDG